MRRRDGGELLPAILRIDVDKPFLGKKSFTKRNTLFLSTGSFFRKKVYLKPCKELIKDLNERGIKASLFFQPFTVPNKEFTQELLKEGHSIGLHAIHTKESPYPNSDKNKVISEIFKFKCIATNNKCYENEYSRAIPKTD